MGPTSHPSAVFPLVRAAGQRTCVGLVAVDSGTVAIGRVSNPAAVDDDEFWTVESSSGVGDGGYDVVTVHRNGALVGVEAVFVCLAAEDAAVAAAAAAGLADEPEFPPPGSDQDAVDAYVELSQRRWVVCTDAYNATLADADPADGTSARVIAEITHDGADIAVIDPYSRSTGPVLTLPAGRYTAVRWTGVLDGWGERVFRLGVYRADSVG